MKIFKKLKQFFCKHSTQKSHLLTTESDYVPFEYCDKCGYGKDEYDKALFIHERIMIKKENDEIQRERLANDKRACNLYIASKSCYVPILYQNRHIWGGGGGGLR